MKKIVRILLMTIPIIATAHELDAQYFFDQFSNHILTPVNLMEMKHPFVIERLTDIDKQSKAISLEKLGQSVEGRSINMLTFGEGSLKVLLWSQMHGDEATATAALLSVFDYLAKNEDSPFVQKIKSDLSIHAIVMLNPDGAERFVRRNAQGVDLNRDAQRLATPEGRILKAMNDRIKPHYGFNLHDMRGRETVGDNGKLLSIALMAPPFNKKNEDSPSRLRAKQLTVLIDRTLQQFIPGQVARYKADYMPRAFGDAFQNWGVSTVLVEAGLTDHEQAHFLVRLNFVILMTSFQAMAEGTIEKEDAGLYEQIPLEGPELFDLLIRKAKIFNGQMPEPLIGDIGINIDRHWKQNRTVSKGTIEDIGDLSIYTGRQVIEGDHLIVIPGLIARIDSKVSENELAAKGITTAVIKSGNNLLPHLQDRKLSLSALSEYTAEAANLLNLEKKGIIDVEMDADLLVIKDIGTDDINLDQLLYVIKNGKIVFQAE